MKKNVIKQVVGIDIGKDDFYACYKVKYADDSVVIKGTKKFINNFKEMDQFYEWCQKRSKKHEAELVFIMEATGVYYEEVAYYLHAKNEKVSVQLAQKIKYFAKSLNLKTKTDKVDSKIIADFGMEKNLAGIDLWTPPGKQFKAIRDLTREHTNIKQKQSSAKVQLHALDTAHEINPRVIEMKKEQILFYSDQINQIESELKRLVKLDKELDEKITKVCTIKGVGFMTALKVLSETNAFMLFTSIRQLVSYAGLDIVHRESGAFKGRTKISKKGNANLRSALYMPALNASVYNDKLKTYYERINQRQKAKKQGTVAVMRKLLILIYTLWKKNEEYIVDYQSQ